MDNVSLDLGLYNNRYKSFFFKKKNGWMENKKGISIPDWHPSYKRFSAPSNQTLLMKKKIRNIMERLGQNPC